MSSTYQPIAINRLGSSTAQISFTNIPGSFTDLVLQATIKTTSSQTSGQLYFNSTSGASVYNQVWYRNDANGNAGVSKQDNQAYFTTDEITSSTRTGFYSVQIGNYAATDRQKTILAFAAGKDIGSTAGMFMFGCHTWASTSAVTDIFLRLGTGSFQTGSVFTLYGIRR